MRRVAREARESERKRGSGTATTRRGREGERKTAMVHRVVEAS